MTRRRAAMRPAGAPLGLLLATLALFVRMVVPAGFMPMAAPSGLPSLVLCSGAGPTVMSMPPGMAMGMAAAGMAHQDGHPDGHEGDSAKHGCFLAAVGGALDVAAPAVPLPVRFVVAAPAPLLTIALRPGLGLAAPPPPKTGPPFLR